MDTLSEDAHYRRQAYRALGQRRRRLQVCQVPHPGPSQNFPEDSFRFFLPSMNVWCELRVA